MDKRADRSENDNILQGLIYAEPPVGLKTHPPERCTGQYCCIHNPSAHHMVTWPLNWRDDKGHMERICPHGIGHPDPDDMAYWERLGKPLDLLSIHGCDGCCTPGTAASCKDE